MEPKPNSSTIQVSILEIVRRGGYEVVVEVDRYFEENGIDVTDIEYAVENFRSLVNRKNGRVSLKGPIFDSGWLSMEWVLIDKYSAYIERARLVSDEGLEGNHDTELHTRS